jgi:DNA-binding SARP family transcriptional activator
MSFESPRVSLPYANHGDVPNTIQVITLGQFAVLRDGVEIPHPDWQSRKARNLFKLLVCRHGRSVPREAAADLLWPEHPGPPGNRFSVALSTVRKVLDPDHRFPADHFVSADDGAVRLRADNVDVDVASFLQLARDARTAVARGDWSCADGLLRSAEKLYAGDFLEEDQYADWVAPYREEARSAALGVLRMLADASRRRGDLFATVSHLHRILELDPYDEAAWLDLITVESAARHHGEARRLHTVYSLHMLEIGVAAAPLPAVSMVGTSPPWDDPRRRNPDLSASRGHG